MSMELDSRKCQACSTSRVVSCSATSWITQDSPQFSTRRSSTCADSSRSLSIWKVDQVPLSASTTAWLVAWLACWQLGCIGEQLPNSWWTLLTSFKTRQEQCQRKFMLTKVAPTLKTKTSFPSLTLFKGWSWSTAHSRRQLRMRILTSVEEMAKRMSPSLTLSIEQTRTMY